MKKLTWTIAIIFLIFAAPVTAQFYRYTDQNGNLRFTDDLSKIPAEQRAGSIKYNELEALPKASDKEPVTEEENSPAASAKSSVGQMHGAAATAPAGTVSIEELRARVEKMKEQLEAEYLALAKERDTLKKIRHGSTALVGYNKSVDAFNQRAANYEKMSDQLSRLVDEYNGYVLGGKSRNQMP